MRRWRSQTLTLLGLGGLRIGMNVANLVAIGRKPYSEPVHPDAFGRQFTTSSQM
jgi:hypothetical protein